MRARTHDNEDRPATLPPIESNSLLPESPTFMSSLGKKQLSTSSLGGAARRLDRGPEYRPKVEWSNAPGQLASLWGQKLPSLGLAGIQPAKKEPPRFVPVGARDSLDAVQSLLTRIQEGISRKCPSILEEAIERAKGTEYLRAVSTLRKSRSTSDLHRHALESALATQIVQARTTLGRWKLGIEEIKEAIRLRDPDALRSRLDHWNFAEEEPVVQAARKDLALWDSMKKEMPERLSAGLKDKDIRGLRAAIGLISAHYPRMSAASLPHYNEARQLVARHEAQDKALTSAVKKRRALEVEEVLAAWEFDAEDPRLKPARALIKERDWLKNRVRRELDRKPPHGPLLRQVQEAWDFGEDDVDYQAVAKLLARFDEAAADLEEATAVCVASSVGRMLLEDTTSQKKRFRDKTPNFPELRKKVDGWEFSVGPQCGCPALETATLLVERLEELIVEAVDGKDGWALDHLWSQLGTKLPSEGRPWAADAVELLEERQTAAEAVRTCLGNALTFAAEAEPEVRKHVESWKRKQLHEDDPAIQQAMSWLRLHQSIADRSRAELQAALELGSAALIHTTLERIQGLAGDDPIVKQAVEFMQDIEKANRTARCMALGENPDDIAALTQASLEAGGNDKPRWSASRDLEIAKNTASVVMLGEKVASAIWAACGGNVNNLEACVERATSAEICAQERCESLQGQLLGLLVLTQGNELGREAEDPHIGLLDRTEQLLDRLRNATRGSPKRSPLYGAAQEASSCLLENATHVDPANASAISLMSEAVDAVRQILSDVGDAVDLSSTERRLPDALRGLGRERPLQFCPATSHSSDLMEWEVISEIRLESLAVAKRLIKAAPSDCRGIEYAWDFVGIMEDFYEDFLPLYAAWSSAATYLEESTRVKLNTKAALAASRSGGSDIHRASYLESMVFPAMYVENVERAAASAAEHLFKKLPPHLADAQTWLKWIANALETGVASVQQLSEELKRIADQLDPEKITERLDETSQVHLDCLKDVIHRILGEQDGQALKKTLLEWSPLDMEEITSEGLYDSVLPLLVESWDWYVHGCDNCAETCALFVWASLAVSLLPLIPKARKIAPVRDLVQKASQKPGAAWKQIHSFSQSGDQHPWWWLELLGCTDAERIYGLLEGALDREKPKLPAGVASNAASPSNDSKPAFAADGDNTPFEGDDSYNFEQEDAGIPKADDRYSPDFEEPGAQGDPDGQIGNEAGREEASPFEPDTQDEALEAAGNLPPDAAEDSSSWC